jgi:hypothetical protein
VRTRVRCPCDELAGREPSLEFLDVEEPPS